MIDILESVRRTVYRWVNTTVSLTANANYNTTTLKVTSSRRFRKGDEVAIHNGTDGEPGLVIAEIIDDNTIELATPIKVITGWTVANNAMLTKTYNGQFVQAIYIGDPDVIPRYPAITILGKSRASEWFTLGTTKERYELTLGIYVESDNDEKSYRTVMQLTDIIQLGLKKNIFPLLGPTAVTSLLVNAQGGDDFLKVADSSIFQPEDKILIENIYQAEELRVKCTIDSETIQIWPNIYFNYNVADSTKIVRFERFVYNSWPANIDYGYKVKESLLHAATISWFAEEQEIQTRHGWSDPHLS